MSKPRLLNALEQRSCLIEDWHEDMMSLIYSIMRRAKNHAELRVLVARGLTDLRQCVEYSAGDRRADTDSDDGGDAHTVRNPPRVGRAGAKRRRSVVETFSKPAKTKKAKKASKKKTK